MLKKVIILLKKLSLDFYRIQKEYSASLALYNLIWWINFYIPSPLRFKLTKWALINKTKHLNQFIKKKYPDVIQKYSTQNSSITSELSDRIWVFWGQGYNEMPELVRLCHKNLCQTNPNVILLTNKNLSDFVNLDSRIIQKVRVGKLSWANYSDIIRTKLLYKYGGMWIDASVWVADKIHFKQIKGLKFFSPSGWIKPNNKSICFWTSLDYNWSTWCMYSNNPYYKLFGFLSEIMERVVIDHEYWPDYVFQDYLIYYASKNIPGISFDLKENETIPCVNRNKLASILDQTYDSKLYHKLTSTDTFFKLSFRTKHQDYNKENRLTFYGSLKSVVSNN